MPHHRFIATTLTVRIVDPSPAPAKGASAASAASAGGADDQEVIADLKKAIKALRPKNTAGKSYQVDSVS